MALMTIAQHHGRPGTPTDQAHIESFFSHLKGDWPHLTSITDPAALDTELARIRGDYNTIRLHAAVGYVTPDEHAHRPRPAGRRRPRAERIKQNRASKRCPAARTLPLTTRSWGRGALLRVSPAGMD